MNTFTAVFMDVLGNKTGQAERAMELVRANLLAVYKDDMHGIASSETLVFSGEGQRLRQDVSMLETKISKMRRAGQAAELYGQLRGLSDRTEKLHRETQEEIHRPGHIRAGRLHFFYAREQEEAFDILENYIRTELYRILAVGGKKMFFSVRPLRGYRRTLQERLRYLREEIEPVTDTGEFRERAKARPWGYSHRDSMKAGPMGILPGFIAAEAVKQKRFFMPGEHALLPGGKGGVVLSGAGMLTNVTPENVAQAQEPGALGTEISPEMLLPFADALHAPDAVLGRVFPGKLYAIDPAQYFGTASFVEANTALVRRAQLGRCLFCGQAADGRNFCEKCARRIRIV